MSSPPDRLTRVRSTEISVGTLNLSEGVPRTVRVQTGETGSGPGWSMVPTPCKRRHLPRRTADTAKVPCPGHTRGERREHRTQSLGTRTDSGTVASDRGQGPPLTVDGVPSHCVRKRVVHVRSSDPSGLSSPRRHPRIVNTSTPTMGGVRPGPRSLIGRVRRTVFDRDCAP